jgi:hypothetical protein
MDLSGTAAPATDGKIHHGLPPVRPDALMTTQILERESRSRSDRAMWCARVLLQRETEFVIKLPPRALRAGDVIILPARARGASEPNRPVVRHL